MKRYDRGFVGGTVGGLFGCLVGGPASWLLMLMVFYGAGMPTLADLFRVAAWAAFTILGVAAGAAIGYSIKRDE